MNPSPSSFQTQVQAALLRQLKIDYLVIDRQCRLADCSPQSSVFRTSEKAAAGMHISEILHPIWVAELEAAIPLLTADLPELTIQNKRFIVGDQEYSGKMELSVIKELDCFLVVVEHRSQEKNADTLRERTLQTLLETGMDAVALLGEDGSVLYVSPNVIKLLGYSELECRRLNLFELLHPEDQDKVKETWMKMLSSPGELIKGADARVKHKNGDWRWLEGNMINLLEDPEVRGVVDVFRDITDRKKQQDELLRMNTVLAEAQNLAHIGYWEVDMQLQEMSWSIETYSIWGLDPVKKPTLDYFYSTIHPDDRESFISLNERCLREVGKLDAVHRILLEDGTIKYVRERGAFELGANGEVLKFKGTAQDITEEVNRTESIRISNERLELVNKATSDAIWDWDMKNNHVYWGEGFHKLFGYNLEGNSVSPELWEELIHPDDKDRILSELEIVLANKGIDTWMSEYRFKKVNGEYTFVQDKVFYIRDEKGAPIRMIGAMMDISSVKEAEKKLQEERNRLRAIIDNIPDYIFVKDQDGKHLICNQAQLDLFGVDLETSVSQKTINDLLGEEKASSFWKDDQTVLQTGQSIFNKEEKLFPKDGGLRFALTTKVPIKNETGEVLGLVGISRDITSIRKRQEQDRLLARITEAILVSQDIEVALEEVLALTGTYLEARSGNAWLLNEGQLKLMRTASWGIQLATDRELYLNKHYLGEFWKRGEPAILDEEQYRVSTLLIPVIFQEHTITLLQFYYPDQRKPDQELLEFCAELGSKMGIDIKTKKSELELSMFFTHCPDPLCMASANGFFKKVNPAFIRLLGFEEGFIVSNPILSFVHPEDLAAALNVLEAAFAGQRMEGFECRFKTVNEEWKWLAWSSSELVYEEGVVFAYGKDISELKEAERNLVQFKKVLDSSQEGVAIYTPATNSSYLNHALQEMMGYSPDDFQNLESPALVYANREQGWEMFDTILAGGYFTGEVQLLGKDGRVLDLYLSAGPIFDEDGNVEAVYGIHTDISERKKYLLEILEVNERYNLVAKATNDAIWDWNLLTNEVVRTGLGLESLFGYDSEEANKDRSFWLKRVHPEDLEGVLKRRGDVLMDPQVNYWQDEYRFLKADGKLAYVHDKGFIIRTAEGKAIRMIGATQDITDRKEFLNEILRVQQNLDALINNTGDMIWSYNTRMELIVANHAFLDSYQVLTGMPIEEGMPILSDVLPYHIIEQWKPLYERSLLGESFTAEQVYFQDSGKDEQYYMVSFTPMRNEREEVVGAACFARNISELRKAYRKLEELNQELLAKAEELFASNADLERFAFIASHDLQEPLRMVSSFLQLLKQRYHGQLDKKADTYIEFAVDGANRMKDLIHGLLDYARVGNTSADAVPVDLNLVIRDVQILLKTKIEESNAVILTEHLPIIPRANYTQLLQLMQNLLGNALKYRGEKDPLVQVGVEDSGETWTIHVKDNGIGLDMRYADKVFQVFQRLHQQKTYTGTGIGLSICKRIVEKMGGKIWVDSEPGKGSTFYFTIVK
ncbi:hypothetical protein GCM10027036_04360 [Flavihumibacter cheonanensis]|uniref:PAS domain S-box protein n=1 Tax=Flavihumibacter cheonanensis TaxID=1442385 RepID=UPI001EF8A3B9|nr:PAS domain S-box protein [Flavihumibacter cheonanensis]MCG7752120.1 PAS domain S-box protein [Flavihumibacter cheonanensis]